MQMNFTNVIFKNVVGETNFESVNSLALKSKLFLKFADVLKLCFRTQGQMSDFHLSKDKVDQKSNSLVSSQSDIKLTDILYIIYNNSFDVRDSFTFKCLAHSGSFTSMNALTPAYWPKIELRSWTGFQNDA